MRRQIGTERDAIKAEIKQTDVSTRTIFQACIPRMRILCGENRIKIARETQHEMFPRRRFVGLTSKVRKKSLNAVVSRDEQQYHPLPGVEGFGMAWGLEERRRGSTTPSGSTTPKLTVESRRAAVTRACSRLGAPRCRLQIGESELSGPSPQVLSFLYRAECEYCTRRRNRFRERTEVDEFRTH